jgi:hypothetical protein
MLRLSVNIPIEQNNEARNAIINSKFRDLYFILYVI